MRQRLRHIVFSVAIGSLVLSTFAGPLAVYCHGDDGHAAVELPHEQHCAVEHHEPVGPSHGQWHESHTHCSDNPLGISFVVVNDATPQRLLMPAGQPVIHIAAPDPVESLGGRLAGLITNLPPPHGVGAHLRSVVLLI